MNQDNTSNLPDLGIREPVSKPLPPPEAKGSQDSSKKEYFILSFLPKKISLNKLLPLVLLLFLAISMPLAIYMFKQRQEVAETDLSCQGECEATECACDRVEADRDLGNLSVGEVINFTGFGKTKHDQAIDKIKFIVSKDGNAVAAQELEASLDRQEGDWRFYKANFTYSVEDYGNYDVAIQVTCPGGEWRD